MDHRTIVSFFTCQLVWVNRYQANRYEKVRSKRGVQRALARVVQDNRGKIVVQGKGRSAQLLLGLAMVRAVANRPPKVAVVRRNAHRIVMPTRPSNRTATNNYADRIKTPVLMTGVFLWGYRAGASPT